MNDNPSTTDGVVPVGAALDQVLDGLQEEPEPDSRPGDTTLKAVRGSLTHLVQASQIEPEPVEWLWDGRLPRRALSLIVGRWETSKTTLMLELAARVTRGQLEGHLTGPANVIVASAEDSPTTTLVPRLMAAGADRDRVFFLSISRDGLDGDISLPDDLEALEAAIRKVGAAFVGIDPVSAHLGTAIDSHRDHDVRRVLGPLARIADVTNAAIAGIAHVNKMPSADLFSRISGSVGFGAAARSILVVERPPDAPETSSDRVVVHSKCNVSPKAAALKFKVESRTVVEGIETAGVVWQGIAEGLTSRDVLRASDRDAPERERAEKFLGDLLADGPRSREDVKAEAEEAGISWRTIERAKATLGIVSEQIQEPGKIGRGPSYWRLPGFAPPAPNTKEVADQITAGQDGDSGFGPPGPPGPPSETPLTIAEIATDGDALHARFDFDNDPAPCSLCSQPCTARRRSDGLCVHPACESREGAA